MNSKISKICPACGERNVGWGPDGIGKPIASDSSSKAKPARVRISAVKVDIENAFHQWSLWTGCQADVASQEEHERDVQAARARVFAFLDQVEADRKQLHDALAACNLLVTALAGKAINPALVVEARRLALIALAHPGP